MVARRFPDHLRRAVARRFPEDQAAAHRPAFRAEGQRRDVALRAEATRWAAIHRARQCWVEAHRPAFRAEVRRRDVARWFPEAIRRAGRAGEDPSGVRCGPAVVGTGARAGYENRAAPGSR